MNESVDEDAIVCLECESAMRSYNTFPPPLALLMVVVVVSFPFVAPDPNPDFLTVINRPSTRPPTPRELIAKKPFANSNSSSAYTAQSGSIPPSINMGPPKDVFWTGSCALKTSISMSRLRGYYPHHGALCGAQVVSHSLFSPLSFFLSLFSFSLLHIPSTLPARTSTSTPPPGHTTAVHTN